MTPAAGLLTSGDLRWQEALERIPHDLHHTPAYHRLSGFGQAGEAQAFLYQEGERVFLWPYLLQPIPQAPGYHDIRSVYGYPGPVGSPDPAFLARAWTALKEAWAGQRVVSAFTRFHPLLNNAGLFASIPEAAGGLRAHGPIVSIDLTLPEAEQYRRYHKNLRQEIRKLRQAAVDLYEDGAWSRAADFVAVYTETMARLGSPADYLVDLAWIARFREAVGAHAHLLVAEYGGETAGAMIVIGYGSFLTAHLVGSRARFAHLSPTKLLIDEARRWGAARGFRTLNLGGGLGGRQDDLFFFKSRFSPDTHTFHTGQWRLDAQRFRELEAGHRQQLEAQGVDWSQVDYFPPYRFQPARGAG